MNRLKICEGFMENPQFIIIITINLYQKMNKLWRWMNEDR